MTEHIPSRRMQFSESKLHPPQLPLKLTSDAHLIAQLEQSLSYPFTLMIAPRGAGKTTLLADWLHQRELVAEPLGQVCVAWLTLDQADNQVARFWVAVLMALDSCQPERYAPLAPDLSSQSAPNILPILTNLINTCAQQSTPLLLILDQYQEISATEIHETLTFLLQHQPPQLHVLLATNAEPPLPIANLRARGKLLELPIKPQSSAPIGIRSIRPA